MRLPLPKKNLKTIGSLWGQLYPSIKAFLGILATLTVIPAVVVSIKAKQGYWGTFFVQQPTDALVKLNDFEDTFHRRVSGLF